MSIPEDHPVQPTRCPWHASTDCVEPATDHEYERTGCRWRCNVGPGALFTGTATEFQRIRPTVLAAEAERMSTSPRHTNGDEN